MIVSSMCSLSSLYLRECLARRGVDATVASFGTTVLTARKTSPTSVRVMTRRTLLGVSAIPAARTAQVVALCAQLFGEGFVPQENALASALANINPVAHVPLALFNLTRIDRAEHWPQYRYMTAAVSSVIERIDAERLAVARAFGLAVRTIEEHFRQSFDVSASRLADIAAELHAKRGGPPGPTDLSTRFLGEDVPFGLVFHQAIARIAGVSTPAIDAAVAMADLVHGAGLRGGNDLLEPLRLRGETVAGLLARVAR